MAHLIALGLEIALVGGLGGDDGGDALGDLNAGEFEGLDLCGIVGDESNGVDAQLLEDLGREFELAAVGLVSELKVGFDGVEALVLEFVGAKLGHESDASALLLFVKEDTGASIGDHGEGKFELLAAITTERVENVSGEALGVDANNGRLAVNIAHDEGDGSFDSGCGCGDRIIAGLRSFDDALESEDAEVSPAGREVGIGYFAHRGEGHGLIIRFDSHKYWILLGMSSMQRLDRTA
jgi:hypothetical protein